MRLKLLLLLNAFFFLNAFYGEINPVFFEKTDLFMKETVVNGLIDYQKLVNDNTTLKELIKLIEATDLTEENALNKKAFYINSYNLIVINSIVENYPLISVQDINGFFDLKKHLIAGEKITLNNLEKNKLIKEYMDARLHFVLVCGAIGCPPITNFAYLPEKLEQQLEIQTKRALNDITFIRIDTDKEKVKLSEIFKWYANDFGGSKTNVFTFINKFKTDQLLNNYSLGYYSYDWGLNDKNDSNTDNQQSSNSTRYVISAAIKKGTHELKLFNNLFSQTVGEEGNGGNRSTFFTTSFSYLYGLSNNLNIGFQTNYRRVRNDILPASSFDVFGNNDSPNSSMRQGITFLGPKIRWAPLKKWSGFSLESTFLIPGGDDQEGNNNEPFIDWNKAIWRTQFFYDLTIGRHFSLFSEIDLIIEDIGFEEGDLNRTSTPLTVVFSYFPNKKTTIYGIGTYSPFYQEEYDYFYQLGSGLKYQITRSFELEFLYTPLFQTKFLNEVNQGKANTLNFGVRVSM